MNGNPKLPSKHKCCVEGVVLIWRALRREIDSDVVAKIYQLLII
jgi:hypothetical protein